MTLDQIKLTVDGALDRQLPTIAAAQASYLKAHGKFAQVLPTHSVLPKDGAETAPDRLDRHPAKQAESARALGQWPDVMMAGLEITQRVGPSGKSYLVEARFERLGAEYLRVQEFSEAGKLNDTGWQRLIKP
jgi:hypothetical protein